MSDSVRSYQKELWVDKYKPSCLEELAVQRKKVEEVKVWFEQRLGVSKDKFSSHVLDVTGQAGVGKSATVQAIASHLGGRLCEWNTPTPIIWQEHLHTSTSGLHYTSKLDEFENFVERIRKYGVIPSTSSKESKESVMLLIDDLPISNGRLAFGRLRDCLNLLVHSIQIPTAILVTTYGEADSADQTTPYLEELQLCLEKAGACKVAFNPITLDSTKKVLSRICKQEECNVTVEQIDLIAKTSRGSIRNAITSLQFFCLRPSSMHPLSLSNPSHSKYNANEIDVLDAGFHLNLAEMKLFLYFMHWESFCTTKEKLKTSLNWWEINYPYNSTWLDYHLKWILQKGYCVKLSENLGLLLTF